VKQTIRIKTGIFKRKWRPVLAAKLAEEHYQQNYGKQQVQP
jgi:hypothetical protein